MSYARNAALSPRDAKFVDLAFNLLNSDAGRALNHFEQVKNPNARVYLGMMRCYLSLKDYSKAFNLRHQINEAELVGHELGYFRSRLASCYSYFAIQSKKKAKAAFALDDLSTAIQELDGAQRFLELSQALKSSKEQHDSTISLELDKIRTECCKRLAEMATLFFKHSKPVGAITYFKQAQNQARVLESPKLLTEAEAWVMDYYSKQMKLQLKKGQRISKYNQEAALAAFGLVLALQQEAAELLGQHLQFPFPKLAEAAVKGINKLSHKAIVEEKEPDSTGQILSSFSTPASSSEPSSPEPSMDVIIDIHDEEEEQVDLPWKKPSVSLTASYLFPLPPLLVNLQNNNYNPNVKEHFAPLISPYRR